MNNLITYNIIKTIGGFMEEKLEINFQEPLLGLLVMNLENLEWHVNQKKLGSQSGIANLLAQLEKFETENELHRIKSNWLLLKPTLEKVINKFTTETGWSKNLIRTFLMSDAIFDLLTTDNSILSELKINLETQTIRDYQQLISLMKKLAVKKMHQNYAILNQLWLPLETSSEFNRVSKVTLNLDNYLDFIESQALIWDLLTTTPRLPQASQNWRSLAPLMNNEAIITFIDFFENNLDAIDEESHLRRAKTS